MDGVFTFLGIFFHNHFANLIAHTVLCCIIIIVVAKISVSNMRIVPRALQNIMESYIGGVISMGNDIMDKKDTMRYLPLIATLGLFIFTANMIGIIPGFESPSANLNYTLPLAVSVFLYYNYEGIRRNGLIKYTAHFLGSVKWLTPLMFPIEVISHLSRIISLSFRLFGNIKGDDLFLIVLLMLAPFVFPLLPFAILLFMAVLQTFIFMILSFVYLVGAIELDSNH